MVSIVRPCLVATASVLSLLGCSTSNSEPTPQPGVDTEPRASTASDAAQPETEQGAHVKGQTTATCNFRQLLGVVLNPEQQRVEILETNQEFAGDTGLPPTGTGSEVAALTQSGLTVGNRCRIVASPQAIRAAPDVVGPYPEKYATWLRCGIYGSLLLDATPYRGGYRLTIGGPPHATVRVVLLPKRNGHIAFSVPTCRRFVVTDNIIP